MDPIRLREEMTNRLRHWMERTRDPLLNGELTLPPDAKINPRHETDPNGRLVNGVEASKRTIGSDGSVGSV